MSNLTVTKDHSGGERGRYVVTLDGAEAELTFVRRGEGVVSADHTRVPDAIAGRGVAGQLLRAMLDDARGSGFRIVPVCDYVLAQYAKHPEWQPLFTTKPGEKPQDRRD